MNITYEKFVEMDDFIKSKLDALQATFNTFPRGEMGLTPEHIRLSPLYKQTRREWDHWMRISREFSRVNKAHCRHRANLKRQERMNKFKQG